MPNLPGKTSCCCCGCSLRVGSLIYSWCAVGFWLLFLILAILGIEYPKLIWHVHAPWLTILGVFNVIIFSLMLAGVSERNIHFLRISILLYAFEIVIISISNFIWFILSFQHYLNTIYLLMTLFFTVLNIHWFQVVASYYEEIIKPTPAVQIV